MVILVIDLYSQPGTFETINALIVVAFLNSIDRTLFLGIKHRQLVSPFNKKRIVLSLRNTETLL